MGRAATHRKEPSVDVAAWPHGLERQRFERVSKQRDLTMLNLEDLGASQIELGPGCSRRSQRQHLTDQVIASPMESVQHHADELNK